MIKTVRNQCIKIELDDVSEICDDEIRWLKESRSTSLPVVRRKKPLRNACGSKNCCLIFHLDS